MLMPENPDFFTRIILSIDPAIFYAILLHVKLWVKIMDVFLDLFFGWTITKGSFEDRQKAQTNYHYSAQRVKVLGRACLSFASKHQLRNYLCRHLEYISPEIVLNNPCITLQGISTTEAFFCVSDINVYQMSKAPFAFLEQFFSAKELIIMPLESFYRLGKDLPVANNVSWTFIGNTARCGSTLLCQMMDKVKNTRVISETWTPMYLHGLYQRGLLTMGELRKLLSCAIKLQLKQDDDKIERFVYKMPMLAMPVFCIIHELFPTANFVFATRTPKASLLSFAGVHKSIGNIFYYRARVGHKFWYQHMPIPYENQFIKLKKFNKQFLQWRFLFTSEAQDLARTYAGSFLCYLAYKDQFNATIVYEDLINNIEEETRSLFDKLNFPQEEMPKALTALEKHSQNNMFQIDEKPTFNDNDWQAVNKVFKEFGLDLKGQSSVEDVRRELQRS